MRTWTVATLTDLIRAAREQGVVVAVPIGDRWLNIEHVYHSAAALLNLREMGQVYIDVAAAIEAAQGGTE